MSDMPGVSNVDLIRHFLATLAFRASVTFEGAPEGFGEFDAGQEVMTPLRMLNHINAVLGFGKSMVSGEPFQKADPGDWNEEVSRFHEGVAGLDKVFMSGLPEDRNQILAAWQGPLVDAMTHVGQLAMLRRLAGSPVERVNYIKAEIKIGNVGPR